MLEIWSAEFAPDIFWQQTVQTYIASLDGRVSARKRDAERDLILAYNTGAFSRADKVKPLRHYMKQLRGGESKASAALNFFQSLQSSGAPVTITRVSRSS